MSPESAGKLFDRSLACIVILLNTHLSDDSVNKEIAHKGTRCLPDKTGRKCWLQHFLFPIDGNDAVGS